MKRFLTVVGLGFGITLGVALVYALFTNETMRLVVVGMGAFFLAAITIGGTALAVNRQWTGALGSHRTSHTHRYHLTQQTPPDDWSASPAGWNVQQNWGLLPPSPPVVNGEQWWPQPDTADWQGEDVVA
jgi:hypothetical protein